MKKPNDIRCIRARQEDIIMLTPASIKDMQVITKDVPIKNGPIIFRRASSSLSPFALSVMGGSRTS